MALLFLCFLDAIDLTIVLHNRPIALTNEALRLVLMASLAHEVVNLAALIAVILRDLLDRALLNQASIENALIVKDTLALTLANVDLSFRRTNGLTSQVVLNKQEAGAANFAIL